MAKKIIKAQMQQRHDTRENWAANNPVLLEGEIGLVTDDPNLYKVGDGRTAWNDLKFRGFDGTLAQELGDNSNAAISQKAVSEKITELESDFERANVVYAKNPYSFGKSMPTSEIATNVGYIKIEDGALVQAESSAWRYAILPIEQYVYIETIGTQEGGISGLIIPAIAYLTTDSLDGYIYGSERFGEEYVSVGMTKFFGEVGGVDGATHILVNYSVKLGETHETFCNTKEYIIDTINEKFLAYVADTKNIATNVGYIKIEDRALVQAESSAWRYAILPIEQYVYIETIGTQEGGTSGLIIPAIAYLTTDSLDGYIYGSERFGEEYVSVGMTKFFGEVGGVDGATHILVNYSVKLGGDCVVKNYITLDDIQREIAEIPHKDSGETIVVKKDGTGNYDNIASAFAFAKTGDVILVYDGIYEENHLNLPRGVKVKGVGNVEIRGILPENTNLDTITNYSTIEAVEGCDLENLTITAKNLRYPIHAQTARDNESSVFKLINCRLIHYGNQTAFEYHKQNNGASVGSVFRAISAWGCGLNGGDEVYMDGCYLESRMRAMSLHNDVEQNGIHTSKSSFIAQFRNCEFVSKGIDTDGGLLAFNDVIHIQHLNSETPDLVVIENCKASGFFVTQITGEGFEPTIKVRITGTNNLKMAFNTYGGIGNSMTNQETVFKDFAWYPIIHDEIETYMNRGAVDIPKGCAVGKTSLGVKLMEEGDEFVGIAMTNINKNDIGDVKTKGFIHRIYCKGLESAPIVDGGKIYLAANGALSTSGTNAVAIGVDNNNIQL